MHFSTPLTIHRCDVGCLIDNVLDTVHGQGEIFDVIGGQRDVDVHQRHHEEGGYGQRPPPIGIVTNA